jgi:hypothetical protein
MTESDVAQLLTEIRAEFPRFRLIPKLDSRLQRAIGFALRALTFGRQTAYLTHYVTTIGRTVYTNTSWDARSPADRYATLCHERVHLRQFRRYGLIPMALAYLLLPLPLGLAYVRARLEWQAYAETLRVTARIHGPAAARDKELRAHIVAQFTGPSYGWMWPFPQTIGRWIDAVLSAPDMLG